MVCTNNYIKNASAIKIGYISAVLAAVLFGSVSTVAKPLVGSVNPLLLSSLVYLVSAATLTPLAWKQKFPSTKKNYLLIIAIAISGAVIAPSLYFFGLTHATASDAAVMVNGEIFFSVLLALVFFKEKLRLPGYVAASLVLVGIFIVTTDLDFATLTLQQIHYQDTLIIVATLFWAVDNNLSRILAQKANVAKIAQIKSAIGGTILLAIAVFAFGNSLNISIFQVGPILLLGVAGFAASLYFFVQSLKRIGTVKTILVFSTSTVFGLIFASIFLQEQVSIYQIAATAIIIFGIYLLNRNETTTNQIRN
ncbi:MAG: DMT family transporter [Thaumarchaeota archaeon]|nr:DMT family transporter [Nitrososphaerota archaeon]